jgi:WD40 repeat protein
VGCADGVTRFWKLATGELLAELPGHDCDVNSLAVSRDGSRLISGGTDTTVIIWDTAFTVKLPSSGR